ncbi:unnamed protein product [Adineta ricciae]|uniref:Uncharacterized protein n=1 Tax=Adineta ricciae TaxID=249248 RepID=A0A814XJU9_ADIRI|nr:unnamed protein product [Adineta ricciae]
MSNILNLFIFDFDDTLSIRGSCYPIEELATNQDQLNLKEINYNYEKIHRCWNRRMNEVHKKLAEQGVHTQQIIEACRSIELSPGTHELFRDIVDHNGKIVIMSNACDLVVEECLRAQNLLQYVDKIESNPVRQIDPVIVIDEYENPLQTTCQFCDPNLCKGSIIDQYRKRNLYDKMVFVGDGDNDVCAALHLNKTDYVFAKYDETSEKKVYDMYDLLKNRYFQQLKTELFMASILAKRITSQISSTNKRQFFTWLNAVWNRYDQKRVQEIGPDRACAEWLLRCGGAVRFKNRQAITTDYNAIPSGGPGQQKVEEIRAVKACITSDGFAYLKGLTDLRKVHLEKCDQIGDGTITRLKQSKDTLESVALIDLPQLTENGVGNLTELKNLKQIDLARLPGVKNRDGIVRLLTNELPGCHVNYDDSYPHAPELQEK